MSDKPNDRDAWPGAFDLPEAGQSASQRASRRTERQQELRRAREEYESHDRAVTPREIELTSKRWKRHQLFGCLMMAGGLVGSILLAAIAGALFRAHEQTRLTIQTAILAVGSLLAVAGLCRSVYGRIGAWWHHG